MFIFLTFIKSAWQWVLAFLNTKTGQICTLIIVGLLSLWYAHHRGYNAGRDEQIAIYEKDFAEKLHAGLEQFKVKQTQADKAGIETKIIEEKIVTVYEDRVKTVTEYVNANPYPADCEMTEEHYQDYLKLLEDVK